MWEIRIRKADNGFVASWWDELDDSEHRQCEQVFEAPDSEWGDLDCMRNMLFFIKEYFGVNWSKHNKTNLYIEVRSEEDKNDERD